MDLGTIYRMIDLKRQEAANAVLASIVPGTTESIAYIHRHRVLTELRAEIEDAAKRSDADMENRL